MNIKLYRTRLLWIKLFTAATVLAAFGLASGHAYAAAQDITLTPTTTSPIIKPGAVYNGSFQVVNQGKSGYKFLVYSTPYSVSGENYTPDFTVLPTAPNISGWLNFSSPGGYIKPGQTLTIHYTISVPENTQPGGYYAAAFAETQYPKIPNTITLNERVGELFYIEVAGPVVKKGEVLSWQSSLLQKPPLTSTLRLQDSGSIHYPATIHYYVKDILGHNKYSLYTVKELLPQTIRKIPIPWTSTPSIGLFKVSGTVSFLGQNKQLPSKWVLVMSPLVRIITIVFIILLIVLVIVGPRRSTRRKAKKRRKNLDESARW